MPKIWYTRTLGQSDVDDTPTIAMTTTLFSVANLVPALCLGAGVAVSLVVSKVMAKRTKLTQVQKALIREDMVNTRLFERKRLLTPNEAHFFGVLQRALAPRYVVLTQVGLGALIDCNLPSHHPDYLAERGQFVGKLLDFVVLDSQCLDVVCVIELDDRTHDPLKDRRRDKFVAQVGYRSLRYLSKSKPSEAKIRTDVDHLGAQASKPRTPAR